MELNIGSFYALLIVSDQEKNDFGLIPMLAGCCDGEIGALNAEGFCERVNSAAKLLLTTKNANLND